jgi:hypothetical protein
LNPSAAQAFFLFNGFENGMRDTTLNTIAVVIFGVTMASLLGRSCTCRQRWWRCLSPWGWGSLASTSWAGGAYWRHLMDTVAWASPEHRQRVLHHEAGHFLAAVLLDIPVEAYTLNTWEAWRQGIPARAAWCLAPVT